MERVKTCSILNKTKEILNPGATCDDRLDPGPMGEKNQVSLNGLWIW